MSIVKKVFAIAILILSMPASAGVECKGPLTETQYDGFKWLFAPMYSPGLTHIGGRLIPENYRKTLSKAEIKTLENSLQRKRSTTLTAKSAETLKGWLNENASFEVPGWLSTATGVASSILLPGSTLVSPGIDSLVQQFIGSGTAGRIKLANLAGSIGENDVISAYELITKNEKGQSKFYWLYVLDVKKNDKVTTTIMRTCEADYMAND